ncbi:hypothetical protein KI387_040903, partial [Taxus chinensis]
DSGALLAHFDGCVAHSSMSKDDLAQKAHEGRACAEKNEARKTEGRRVEWAHEEMRQT